MLENKFKVGNYGVINGVASLTATNYQKAAVATGSVALGSEFQFILLRRFLQDRPNLYQILHSLCRIIAILKK